MRTEQAFVYRAGLLTKVPVASLTVDGRAEFEGIPAPRHQWPTYHGPAEDFSTEHPLRGGW